MAALRILNSGASGLSSGRAMAPAPEL
jgi:hypothetical protein